MEKITLFIMTEKGYLSFKSILNAFGSSVVDFIVIGEDKKVDNDFSLKIRDLARTNRIEFYSRREAYIIKTKYVLAISWRWIIPLKDKFTLITLHDSLLPKYRGFAPLVNQLINGEKRIGVSAIESSLEFDMGDIINQKSLEIKYPLKISDAIKKVGLLYQEISTSIVKEIQSGVEIKGIPQDELEATYSLWRDEEDYRIDWSKSAAYIKRFIDAVGLPYSGAFSELEDVKIRIFEASEESDVKIENRDPGKVLFIRNDCPVVVCGEGLIKIEKAIFEESGKSVLPLNKFRVRFK